MVPVLYLTQLPVGLFVRSSPENRELYLAENCQVSLDGLTVELKVSRWRGQRIKCWPTGERWAKAASFRLRAPNSRYLYRFNHTGLIDVADLTPNLAEES